MGVTAVVAYLLLLLETTGATNLCYDKCECEEGRVQCSSWNFSNQLELPRETSTIILENSQGSIGQGYFENYTELKVIKVENATNISVLGESFRGLFHVTQLEITHTDLPELTPVALALLPRLEILNLTGNHIRKLNRGHFAYNTRLKTLVLANNLVRTLPQNTFKGLYGLVHLDISGCLLKQFDLQRISHLFNLRYINLSRNKIEKLIKSNIQHGGLTSRNKTTHTTTHAGNTLLFPNLTTLDLSSNKLSTLPLIGTAVETLNIDDNSFTVANRSYIELPLSLLVLHLSNNSRLTHVGRNFLKQCRRITHVYISHNGMLHTIEQSAFDYLPRVRVIDVSHNILRHIPRSLKSAPSLQLVRYRHNAFVCDCGLLSFWRQRTNRTEQLTCSMDTSVVSVREAEQHLMCSPLTIRLRQRHAWTAFNATAVLTCQITGHPPPAITWITPSRYVFHWWPPGAATVRHHTSRHTARLAPHEDLDHYRVLSDGRLHVAAAAWRHHGLYVCIAENSVEKLSDSVYLMVGVASLHDIKIMALLLGLAACLTAISIALSVRIGMFIFYQCGCCTCCSDEPPPRIKRLKQILESVEQWRTHQLESLRDNYTQQVAGIKDSCYQQVERLRDTYKGQARYLGDMREYGAQQIEGFREQYVDQVRRVRNYSLNQMNRVHENYIFQRNRIRKYSSHQLVRLRETARYQQRTLNKLIETLPDLNLQNCRTGSGQTRTDSQLFPWNDEDDDSLDEPELGVEEVGDHEVVLQCTARPLATPATTTCVIIEHHLPDDDDTTPTTQLEQCEHVDDTCNTTSSQSDSAHLDASACPATEENAVTLLVYDEFDNPVENSGL